METPSGWPCITSMYLIPMLDLTLKASGARVAPTIRLLKKDKKPRHISVSETETAGFDNSKDALGMGCPI